MLSHQIAVLRRHARSSRLTWAGQALLVALTLPASAAAAGLALIMTPRALLGCHGSPVKLRRARATAAVAGYPRSPRFRASSSAVLVQRATPARAFRVSGCPAPRTRSVTGSSAANWSRAPAASPASPVK
jgi:hypothetical protein